MLSALFVDNVIFGLTKVLIFLIAVSRLVLLNRTLI